MGAVQKLATVVIIGLTGLATLLVFLLADEPGRRDEELTEQEEVAIARGIDTYIANCLVCHGPAGEGSREVDAEGNPLRIGAPIGGNTPARLVNQTDDPVLAAEREEFIRFRIHAGSPPGCGTIFPQTQCAMPPWGQDYGGELNDQQIEELVLMIQHVDWDLVYNEAIEASGGYPTPPVEPEATEEGNGDGGDGETGAVRLEAWDIGWRTADQPGPEVELTVAPGATIELVNAGAAEHDFSLDDHNNEGLPNLEIDVDMPAGFSGTVQIPADAPPGTYYFYCDVPGHEAAGMHGTITIDPNAGGGEAPPPAASPEATPGAAPAEASPVATPVGTPAQAPTEDGAAGETVHLEAFDIGWRTADQPGPQVSLTVAPGTTIEIVNTGAAGHNFDLEALGIFVDLPPGTTAQVDIPADTPPGEYEFVCSVPGHEAAGMVGTLTVQ